MKTFRFLPLSIAIVLSLYFLAGCKAGRPARATLPDQLDNNTSLKNDWELSNDVNNTDKYLLPGLPFYAVDTAIDGKQFTAIFLRNPDFDSLAFNIVKSYEPFTNSLFQIIASQGIKGILIDFRENRSDRSGEATFSVSENNEQKIGNDKTEPLHIVFLWDEFSASRAAVFMNELNTSSVVAVKNVSSAGFSVPLYRQDCFRPGYKSFDEE